MIEYYGGCNSTGTYKTYYAKFYISYCDSGAEEFEVIETNAPDDKEIMRRLEESAEQNAEPSYHEISNDDYYGTPRGGYLRG